jgi:antitoxin (DNA-binding transcriptional repressor) of toxin-antitoxin stability system
MYNKSVKQYNVAQARQQWATILKQVEEGEEIIVTKHGKPLARIERVKKAIPPPGWDKGSVVFKGDFKELPEGFGDYVPLKHAHR